MENIYAFDVVTVARYIYCNTSSSRNETLEAKKKNEKPKKKKCQSYQNLNFFVTRTNHFKMVRGRGRGRNPKVY